VLLANLKELREDQKVNLILAARADIHKELMLQKAKGVIADLQTFFRAAWEIIEPNTLLCWSWHYDYLCEWLTLISSKEFKRRFPEKLGVIVNVPPRSGKSTLCAIWTVWAWLLHPECRFLYASYSNDLAVSINRKRRTLMRSSWFLELFSDRFKLTVDQDAQLENDHTGAIIATSGGHKVEWLLDPMPAAHRGLIEDRANGPAIRAELRRDPAMTIPILRYPAQTQRFESKDSRAFAAQADVEVGNVYLPEDAPWIGSLMQVFSHYAGEGSVAHDDDIDAFTHMIDHTRRTMIAPIAEAGERIMEKAAHPSSCSNRLPHGRLPGLRHVSWFPWRPRNRRRPGVPQNKLARN
jgi:predicted phage terminase large subunit-like protein